VDKLQTAASDYAASFEWANRGENDANLKSARQKFLSVLQEGGAAFKTYHAAKTAYVVRVDRDSYLVEQAEQAKKASASKAAEEQRVAKIRADRAEISARLTGAKSSASQLQQKIAEARAKAAQPKILGLPLKLAVPVGIGVVALLLGGMLVSKKKRTRLVAVPA
jgi:chromosome segregation ATPase